MNLFASINLKNNVLYRSRMNNFEEKLRSKSKRIVYGTNIKKCIELSKEYNQKYYYWHSPKFFDTMETF